MVSALAVCLVTQLRLILCDALDCILPGSSLPGILQARILEWVACPPPGDLPDPGIKPASLRSPAGSLPLSHPGNVRLCSPNKGLLAAFLFTQLILLSKELDSF